MAGAKHNSDFEITKDTTYLALTGELWGVFRKDFRQNKPRRYNGIALYIEIWKIESVFGWNFK